MSTDTRRSAIWALLLSIPVPTIGVWLGMILWPDSSIGELAFATAKVWVIGFPMMWLFYYHKRFVWPPFKPNGLAVATVSGVVIALVIFAAYYTIGTANINPEDFRHDIEAVGLLDAEKFILLALYWTFVNSLLEEYFWRWFIVERAQSFMSEKAAIVLSALGFVGHHLLAMSLYFDITIALLACAGIFVGGVIWSVLYMRYRSILPCYISHILADAAIFIIGYNVLF